MISNYMVTKCGNFSIYHFSCFSSHRALTCLSSKTLISFCLFIYCVDFQFISNRDNSSRFRSPHLLFFLIPANTIACPHYALVQWCLIELRYLWDAFHCVFTSYLSLICDSRITNSQIYIIKLRIASLNSIQLQLTFRILIFFVNTACIIINNSLFVSNFI